MKEDLVAAASAHHPAVLISLSSSSVARRAPMKEDIASAHLPAVLVSLSSSSAAVLEWRPTLQCSPSLPHRAQLRPHWNKGGHRLCLRPPMSILSSSSAAVLEWRWTLQCSPSLPSRPACAISGPLERRRTLPPPPAQQCSLASCRRA